MYRGCREVGDEGYGENWEGRLYGLGWLDGYCGGKLCSEALGEMV